MEKTYRVAIVGSRDYPMHAYTYIRRFIDKLPSSTMIISGGAAGVDNTAIEYAKKLGYSTDVFLPNWRPINPNTGTATYDKGAGFKRNYLIVDASDFVVAFQYNGSKGTQHSIDYAKGKGNKPVFVFDENGILIDWKIPDVFNTPEEDNDSTPPWD